MPTALPPAAWSTMTRRRWPSYLPAGLRLIAQDRGILLPKKGIRSGISGSKESSLGPLPIHFVRGRRGLGPDLHWKWAGTSPLRPTSVTYLVHPLTAQYLPILVRFTSVHLRPASAHFCHIPRTPVDCAIPASNKAGATSDQSTHVPPTRYPPTTSLMRATLVLCLCKLGLVTRTSRLSSTVDHAPLSLCLSSPAHASGSQNP